MSFRIIFRGDIEDVYVDNIRGAALAGKWGIGDLGDKVEINGNLYDSSSIKAILSKAIDPDREKKKDVSREETEELRKHLETYEQKRINGTLISRFDQWLVDVGIRKLLNDGTLVCLQPAMDTKYSKINAALENFDYIRDMSVLHSNPDLMSRHIKMVEDYGNKLKSFLGRVKTL